MERLNTKIIIGAVVLVLIVASVYLYLKPKETPITTPVTTEATEISAVLGDEYASLIQEELNRLSIEQTDFNNQMQDSLANDLSQFYY